MVLKMCPLRPMSAAFTSVVSRPVVVRSDTFPQDLTDGFEFVVVDAQNGIQDLRGIQANEGWSLRTGANSSLTPPRSLRTPFAAAHMASLPQSARGPSTELRAGFGSGVLVLKSTRTPRQIEAKTFLPQLKNGRVGSPLESSVGFCLI